jgi:hypothetical protein
MIEPFDCIRSANPCGQIHTGCSAHNVKQNPCGGPAMIGTTPPRCRVHLGKSSTVHKAQVAVEKQARKIAGLSDSQPVAVDDVLTTHLALAGEVLAWRDALRGMVEELSSVGYATAAGEQTKAAAKLYADALDKADRILTNIGRLNIDDRMATHNEKSGARLTAILAIALAQLGLSVHDDRVKAAVQLGVVQTTPKPLPGAHR